MKRQSTQYAGTVCSIKPFVCPPTSLQRVAGMAAGDSKVNPPACLLSHCTSISNYTPRIHLVPEKLGKSAARMARRAKQVRFSRACVEVRGSYELNSFPKEAHAAAPLLNYMREQGVPIYMPRSMNSIELKKALMYGAIPQLLRREPLRGRS